MSRPERADARHVRAHDRIAALGHDGQLGAGFVGPHAQPQEADAEAIADLLHLRQVTAGLGAGLVEVVERRPRQLELAGGFEADRAVGAGERDDLSVFLDRPPAEFGQRHQQVADSAGLVIARRVVVGARIHELLVLGADPPAVRRLFAAREAGDQLVARFDDG